MQFAVISLYFTLASVMQFNADDKLRLRHVTEEHVIQIFGISNLRNIDQYTHNQIGYIQSFHALLAESLQQAHQPNISTEIW